jgi:hypothetical protein
MVRPKAASPVLRRFAIRAFMALAGAATLLGSLNAQTAKTVTVLMLDGKTGKPIIPSNMLVRVDHLSDIHNDWLQLRDEGLGTVTLPAAASLLSIQGAYSSSMEIYVNCDAAMQKDVHTLHWYSISDILTKGVNTPNECYKGKYLETTHLDTKPGVFVVYVRKGSWHELPEDL